MKNNSKNIWVLGIVLPFLIASTLNALTLKEAVESAITNHPSIKVAQQDVLSKSKQIGISKGAYFPKATLSADFGDKDEKKKADTANKYTKTEYDEGSRFELSVTQNIFNGLKDMSGVSKSKMEFETSKFKKNHNLDALTFNVIKTYLNIVRLEEIVTYEAETINKYRFYVELAQKKVQATGQKSQLLSIQSKLLKLEDDYIKHDMELKQQKHKFTQLTKLEIVDNIDNMDIHILKDTETIPLEEFLNIIPTLNHDLKQYSSKVKENNAQYGVERAALFPTLDLELKTSRDDNIDTHKTIVKEKSAMLKLRYNLFNGLQDKKRLERIKIDNLRLKNEYDEKHLQKIEKVTSTYQVYISSKDRIKTLYEYMSIQEELASLYQEEFKVGKKSLSNLVNMEESLKSAQISYINTLIGMIQSVYELRYNVGNLYHLLQTSDLQIVDLYDLTTLTPTQNLEEISNQ